jgi:hypothetical protein
LQASGVKLELQNLAQVQESRGSCGEAGGKGGLESMIADTDSTIRQIEFEL